MRRSPLLVCLGACLVAALAPSARAHIGNVPAKADFFHPTPPPQVVTDDGGLAWGAYTPEEADQSYHVDWSDGDTDPTGKFTFYYLDHGISDGVSSKMNQVQQLGTVVRDTSGRDAVNIYVSCSCTNNTDGGIVCNGFDAGTGGMRWCDNFVDWDTSQVPDGVYWIAAVNDDPPFNVYNLSFAPVRVRHGSNPPKPVVIVLRPDGIGDADQSYTAGVLASGTAPLTLDFAYGSNDPASVLNPVTPIEKGVAYAPASDGLSPFAWSIGSIPNGSWFLQATVHDGNGQVSYSDSRYGLAVFHQGGGTDGSATIDLAMGDGLVLGPPKSGCSCAVGARSPSTAPAIATIALLALVALRRRRG